MNVIETKLTADERAHLRKILPPCPEAGKGVHRWVFKCCLLLQEEETLPEEWENIIDPLATSRPLQPNEVANAALTITGGRYKTNPNWHAVDERLRSSILAGSGTMQSLID